MKRNHTQGFCFAMPHNLPGPLCTTPQCSAQKPRKERPLAETIPARNQQLNARMPCPGDKKVETGATSAKSRLDFWAGYDWEYFHPYIYPDLLARLTDHKRRTAHKLLG